MCYNASMEVMIEETQDNVRRLRSIYRGMLYRCYNPKSYGYKYYGAKKIEVCELWRKDFWHFYYWALMHGYRSDLTLDRIDNYKGYTPSNCRWINYKEQARNKKDMKYYTIKGVTMSFLAWCDKFNINPVVVRNRLIYGWTIERALQRNVRKTNRGKYRYKGEYKTLTQICKECGKSYKLVYNRLKQGWDLEEALSTPNKKIKL